MDETGPINDMAIALVNWNGRRVYVCDRDHIDGTRRVPAAWVRQYLTFIAMSVVQATQRVWFGTDVSGLTAGQRLAWIEDNLLHALTEEAGGLRVFAEDPSQQPGQSSSSSSSGRN